VSKFDISDFFKQTQVLDKGHIALIDGMVCEPRLKVVNSARVSFNKTSDEFTSKDEKLVRYLYEHGHYSTYRHSFFTFRVKAPLFVMRQWWKYQVGSEWTHDDLGAQIAIPETNWNEVSGRYVEFTPEFYVPNTFRMQSKNNKQGSFGELDNFADGSSIKEYFTEQCNNQFVAYQKMLQEGVAKELARMVLPQNVYSECIWTCSLQTLVHFFQQRLKDDAQFEIREYAVATYDLLLPFMKELIEIKNTEGYSHLTNR
jgi:thymidylate synthase (FAD)